MTRHRAWAGVATLLLLVGAAACGGDDKDGTFGAGPAEGQGDPNAGSGGSPDGGPCDLLEVSEIEAAFGDHGAVADGKALGFSCSWDVGDVEEPGSGIVVVTKARGAGSPEQSLAEIRDMDSNPVEVEGVGDEACLCSGGLWFRSGDITLSVTAFFSSGESDKAKLTTLAQHMLDRV
jgi:hypothetical protein